MSNPNKDLEDLKKKQLGRAKEEARKRLRSETRGGNK